MIKRILAPFARFIGKFIVAIYFITFAWVPYLYRALFGTVWGAFFLALGASPLS